MQYAELTAPQTLTPKDLLKAILAMLDADQPLMVWSSPGLGKSDIAQLAARLSSHIYIDLRLMFRERIDLLGLPLVAKDGRTSYAPPDFLPKEDSQDKYLINLEELPNAKQDMMTAIYQFVLDRRIDKYKLPPGARIIACGNRITDRGGAHRLPPALASRFLHVNLETKIEDWLDWALDNDIDPDVMFYLRFNPDSLHDYDPSREEQQFPCPRTWASVSRIKPHIDHMEPKLQQVLYRGEVGESAATAFCAFLAMKHDVPHPKSVLLDPHGSQVPENASAKVAIASSLCRLANEFNMEAICAYASRLGPEVGEYLVSQCIQRCPDTATSDGYVRWASRTT